MGMTENMRKKAARLAAAVGVLFAAVPWLLSPGGPGDGSGLVHPADRSGGKGFRGRTGRKGRRRL